MDSYDEYFKKKNVGYIRIDGSVKPEIRNERVKEFQSNENIRVAILSITACS